MTFSLNLNVRFGAQNSKFKQIFTEIPESIRGRAEAYLRPRQTSMAKIFSKNS